MELCLTLQSPAISFPSLSQCAKLHPKTRLLPSLIPNTKGRSLASSGSSLVRALPNVCENSIPPVTYFNEVRILGFLALDFSLGKLEMGL